MTDPMAHNFNVILKAVDGVHDHIGRIDDRVSVVSAEVGQVSSDLATNTAELRQLREEFLDFVKQAERTANIQRSETVLGNVEAALERDFGHYKVVRRTSIGTLQAFDLGNVSNKTVQEVSEELMIQTPRYWLAPALVALAAWSRDDNELSQKSVEAAFSRDPRKTSLFFALVLRRQTRMESATRWLKHYLVSLDPRALNREFAVILEAAAEDAFGQPGRALIGSQLARWNSLLRDDPAVARAQVDAWIREMSIHRATVDDEKYPHLSRVSPQWPAVKDNLEMSSALGFVEQRYRAIRDSTATLSSSVVDRLDDMLETLVTEYDAEELPYQRDVAYHKAVIEYDGDLGRAREAADAFNIALEETMDLMTLQTQTALRPKMLGVTERTQKVAIGAARADFEAAVGEYTAGYRSRYLSTVEISLDRNHSNYAMTLGFGSWRTDTSTPQDQAEGSLAAAWQAAVAGYLERVRFKQTNYVIAGAVVVAATLVGFLIGPAAGGVMLLVSVLGAGYWLWRTKTDADKKHNNAVAMRDQALQFSIDIYRAAVAEFVDARLLYEEEDARELDLLELVRSWPTVVESEERFAS